MDDIVIPLSRVGRSDRTLVGVKAAMLGELRSKGLPVPQGFVVTRRPAVEDRAAIDAASEGIGSAFAVRSSGVAEDLEGASFAGQYETYLDVPRDGLLAAIGACLASGDADRVEAYRSGRDAPGGAVAVLVQVMVDAVAAGVTFTADPITGDRARVVTTAVPALGETLVSGESGGEEWVTVDRRTTRSRREAAGRTVLRRRQARSIAALARRIERLLADPQDIEWAIDRRGRLWLLQARPITALPERPRWEAPGPGLWMRNFRLGEWLPEAVTPSFATWLLPLIEGGFREGTRQSVGVDVAFRYAIVDGWYYNSTPMPSIRLLAHVLRQGGLRAVKLLANLLVRVGTNPAAADAAALSELHRDWIAHALPAYRAAVAAATTAADMAPPDSPASHIEVVGREAGIALWYLSAIGGSAWKMEARLDRLCRTHLPAVLPAELGTQSLLRGLTPTDSVPAPHAVQSADWHEPTAGELPPQPEDAAAAERSRRLAVDRLELERRCGDALAGHPRRRVEFTELLATTQKYARIREQQARDFTLGWPVMRRMILLLGRDLVSRGILDRPDDVFFCTKDEILDPPAESLAAEVTSRRAEWERQRRSNPPLTIGTPAPIVGDVVDRTVRAARRGSEPAKDAVVGHPAAPGRARGPVRIVRTEADFGDFKPGDVLVARWTAPAWTPLFAMAAAVVTDGGSLAAHASIVAREYGIPAVVGTGDATTRLRPGQVVVVDGAGGTVSIVDRGGPATR